MFSNVVSSTSKPKKRVTQLVAYYEEIGTPKKDGKRTEPETPSLDLEPSPPKRKKLKETYVEEESVLMEVTEQPVAVEPVEEDPKQKESRSARKSRRLKESTLAKYSKRVFCANEILSTERTYVEALQHLHKAWMLPLSRVLSENDIHRIFGNIVSILRFNETLLGKLERRMKNFDAETTLIGDIFKSLVPFLSMYTDYCCNYGEGMLLVNKLKVDDEEVAAVLSQSVVDSNGQDLQDFCITPVQRVPRYRLLLDQLIKNTPVEHPDYENLTMALQLVSDKAGEINKKMNLVEQQKKMMELHRRFSTAPLVGEDLVQPWRYLNSEFAAKLVKVVDGEVEEMDATLWLFNDIFVLTKAAEETAVSNCKLTVITGQPLWNCFLKKLEISWKLAGLSVAPFQIVNPNGVWNLTIENKTKFKTDFETLRDVVLAHSNEKKQKRSVIKLFANNETQEWMAVEPAPTYASNRVSTQILAAETTEFTKMALEELLSENREIFEARSITPAKTPKKSRLGKLMDAMTPLKWSSKKPVQPTTANSEVASPLNLPAGSRSSLMMVSDSSSGSLTDSTPSRKSMSLSQSSGSNDFSSLSMPVSSPRTPAQGFIPSVDKENGVDACNQADVIRSTIAKLSQSSAALHKSGSVTKPQTPSSQCMQSASTPNLGFMLPPLPSSTTKKKATHRAQVASDSIHSPLQPMSLGSTSSPTMTMEAKRRRHRKASTATDHPMPSLLSQ
jgi:ACT domain-containing protein